MVRSHYANPVVRRRMLTLPRTAWGLAIAVFVVGDFATTVIGIHAVGVVEGHPVSTSVLSTVGVAGIVAAKAVVIAVAYALYRRTDEYHEAIPIALAEVGAIIVGWNIAVIGFALFV